MRVFWHGYCIIEYDSDEEWDDIDFDRHVADIADAIIALDCARFIEDLVAWYDDGDPTWFIRGIFTGTFGDNTLEDFATDAVGSALGIILDRDYEGTYIGLEVKE